MRTLLTWLVCAVLSFTAPFGAAATVAQLGAGHAESAPACDCPETANPCSHDKSCGAAASCAVLCVAPAVLTTGVKYLVTTAVLVSHALTNDPLAAQSVAGLPFRPPRFFLPS
jgi:hypothetical protein